MYNKVIKPDYTRDGSEYWIIGKREDEKKRPYREMEVWAPKDLLENSIKKYITDREEDRDLWDNIIDVLLTNDDFTELYFKKTGYINAVYIKSAEQITKTVKKIQYYKGKIERYNSY